MTTSTSKPLNGQCPNCRQFKLEPRNGRMIIYGAWLTFIGLPLLLLLVGFLFIPIGILMMLGGWLFVPGWYCRNCHWSSVRT